MAKPEWIIIQVHPSWKCEDVEKTLTSVEHALPTAKATIIISVAAAALGRDLRERMSPHMPVTNKWHQYTLRATDYGSPIQAEVRVHINLPKKCNLQSPVTSTATGIQEYLVPAIPQQWNSFWGMADDIFQQQNARQTFSHDKPSIVTFLDVKSNVPDEVADASVLPEDNRTVPVFDVAAPAPTLARMDETYWLAGAFAIQDHRDGNHIRPVLHSEVYDMLGMTDYQQAVLDATNSSADPLHDARYTVPAHCLAAILLAVKDAEDESTLGKLIWSPLCSLHWRDDPRPRNKGEPKVPSIGNNDWPRNGALLNGIVHSDIVMGNTNMKWLEVTSWKQCEAKNDEWTVNCQNLWMPFHQGGLLLHKQGN